MAALEIHRGDTASFTTTILDGNDAPLDLTGKTLAFTAKRDKADAQADAIIAKTTGAGITHATQSELTLGQATITILPDDTEDLPTYSVALDYDIELTNGADTYTTEAGTLTVSADVTT